MVQWVTLPIYKCHCHLWVQQRNPLQDFCSALCDDKKRKELMLKPTKSIQNSNSSIEQTIKPEISPNLENLIDQWEQNPPSTSNDAEIKCLKKVEFEKNKCGMCNANCYTFWAFTTSFFFSFLDWRLYNDRQTEANKRWLRGSSQ